MIDQRRKEAERSLTHDPKREEQLLRLEGKAQSLRLQGEYDKAIVVLSEVLKVRQSSMRKLKAAGLCTSSEVAATVRLLHTFGNVFAQKGDDEKAERAHKDAVRLYQKHRPEKARLDV